MKQTAGLVLLLLLTTCVFAQQDTTIKEEEMDFSQFSDMDAAAGTKRYCTSKVLGISPNKLISIGYDYQLSQQLTNTDPYATGTDTKLGKADIQSAGGLRVVANVPLLSNTKWLVNMGVTYWRNAYSMDTYDNSNYVVRSLKERGLTTSGLNATVFKPLNEKHFILSFASADANGDYTFDDDKLMDYLGDPKITVAAFFGWKRSDRSMIAVGLSRTYRPGANGIIPLVLFNHTFENRKWGIESLFPARLALRRSFNPRNLLLIGYELEGNSYAILNRTSNVAYNNLELRRSEIRPRITYERAITDFIWISAQLGYRINYNFNIDQSDSFRFLGDKTAYYMDNTLSNALYVQVSLNLVSP
ncbi:MAG: hypothetical protein V4590_00290 [Bacteroidota bacterium]